MGLREENRNRDLNRLWKDHGVQPVTNDPLLSNSVDRTWTCKRGHEFRGALHDIRRQVHPCKLCWGLDRLEKLNKKLMAKNIRCMSDHYTTTETMVFVCGQCQHEFETRVDREIKCHYCSQPKPVQQCWRIFELLLGKPFIKSRPDWLINPETGYRLELDGYCKELGVAYEFQGRQHYQTVKFPDGFSDVEKQKKRDELKHEICKRKGVDLIRVSYGSYEDMLTEIYKSLTELGYIQADGNRNI